MSYDIVLPVPDMVVAAVVVAFSVPATHAAQLPHACARCACQALPAGARAAAPSHPGRSKPCCGSMPAAAMAALRIRHEFSALGKPWQNGRIERFFLTLKEKLNRLVPENGTALDSLLTEFSFWYNTIRPHQHLHGCTPVEVWTGIDPYKSAPKAVVRFDAWDGISSKNCTVFRKMAGGAEKMGCGERRTG